MTAKQTSKLSIAGQSFESLNRMAQSRDKWSRDHVQRQAQAIQCIGGTLPENIPPPEHIKEVEKRLKSATPKLALGDKDAKGLLGEKDGSDAKNA